jgi:hypothetical protein
MSSTFLTRINKDREECNTGMTVLIAAIKHCYKWMADIAKVHDNSVE